MAKLTAKSRRSVPKSKVGLPSKFSKKRGAVSGSYPMPDKAHARLAKAFASRFASPSQRKTIDARANRVLRGGKRGK